MGLAKASLEANVRFLAADLGPMGIRVNAISAGPIKTLSAAGIPGLRKMLSHVAAVSPIKRNVTIEDVGNAAAFLCSDLAGGITGEVTYVDGGFNSVGMSFPADAEGCGGRASRLTDWLKVGATLRQFWRKTTPGLT
jgi:enoyl-[acyl-carrier protein] reductase I